eukprot:m.106366 g.106366  ORF g.106366 m.106366 type:complete len:657 (-) comp27715_c0_seq3:398-2368(-)
MGRWWFACGCGGVGRYKKGKFGTDGPRGCTDIGFLVLFGVFWVGVVYLASWAFTYGKAYRLIHGADSWGNVCGRSDNTVIEGVINSGLDMTDRKHQYYSILGGEGAEATTLCVALCPDDSFSCDSNATSLERCQNDYGVCLSGNNSVYTVPVDDQNPDRGFKFNNEYTGCPTSIDNTIQAPVFKRCIPDSTKAVEYATYVLKRNGSYFEQVFESVMASMDVIAYCALISLGISYIIVLLMRYFVRIVVYVCILALVLSFAVLSWFLWTRYEREDDSIKTQEDAGIPIADSEKRDRDFYYYTSITSMIVTIIIVLIVVAMRKSIEIAIRIFREASRVAGKIPTMFVAALVAWVFVLAWLSAWAYIMAYLITSEEIIAQGNITAGTGYGHVKYISRENHENFLWFLIFALFWNFEFVLSCEELTLGGCVVSYYITSGHPPKTVMLKSIYRVLRYHLGTAAFGALIIAIIQTARVVLKRIEGKLKGAGGAVKFCLCCAQCCLGWLKWCMKFVGRMAYVETMLYGLDFCNGAFEAAKVLLANVLTVAAQSFVGVLVTFSIKALVSALIGFIAFRWIENDDSIELKGVVVALICISAWLIAGAFANVLDMTVDALLLLYCEDAAREGGQQYAPDGLAGLIKTTSIKNNKVAPGQTTQVEEL